jgi:hypothetical protein
MYCGNFNFVNPNLSQSVLERWRLLISPVLKLIEGRDPVFFLGLFKKQFHANLTNKALAEQL